ncbi:MULTISPECIES: helix-turn-helix domain-containing protein [Enterococcus]|uniref:Helix-turn-helix transcriptional regulator n=1 Tax=Enterococcus alishanensis TaxID=1303817 RepID=A0ABS6TFQ1_9ENTE|nr:helix-turn-helix transcriptional regulator [Enterococcus alishanensis]MBV7391735.1 helix-turn-helix transcriptional regulator [Enterococcus alishanensis]
MFSDLIKERRKELGWTQQDFADKIFVTRQTISNWKNEKNFPDIPTLIQISDQLDLSLDYLLKEDVNYMKKVEKDYALIKRERRAQKIRQNSCWSDDCYHADYSGWCCTA